MYNNPMYYNNFFPYQNFNSMATAPARRGILAGLGSLGKINWGSILNNTQKTLNVINQAIPVYYQMKPIYNNAKTMFRVFGALRDEPSDNTSSRTTAADNIQENKKNISSNGPIFFT